MFLGLVGRLYKCRIGPNHSLCLFHILASGFPPDCDGADMADEHVTKEQLEAIAAENEEGEKVFYKPPAQKTLQEIQDLDQDDESLRKYKEALLGPGSAGAGMTMVTVCHLGVLWLLLPV